MRTAESLREMSERLRLPVIFKASFDKANRQSGHSYRGPGLEHGLDMLEQVRQNFGEGDHGLMITTDVHEPYQAAMVAQVADILQIPALLCRQTDLIAAAAATGRLINIKKGPFASAKTLLLAAEKVRQVQRMETEEEGEEEKDDATSHSSSFSHTSSSSSHQVMLTERGTFFGYDDLVFDPRNLVRMRTSETLVVQDVTHSVQSSGVHGMTSGGERELIPTIARAAAAVGVDGFFFETHENPEQAMCDGPNQWPLDALEELIGELMEIAEVTQGGRRRRRRSGATEMTTKESYEGTA